MSEQIVIATRESPLALWQAEHVKARLETAHQGLDVRLLGMTSRGDQLLDKPLYKVGGKGLFVKELETALLDARADIAVHSMKDVPMVMPDGLTLGVICEQKTPATLVGCSDLVGSRRCSGHFELAPELSVRSAPARSGDRILAWQRQHASGQARRRRVRAIILACAGLIRWALRIE